MEADEPIVEIATDKVDSEVPAPEAGILLKRLVNEGDVVKVGQAIAQIGAGAGAGASATAAAASNGTPKAVPAPAPASGPAAVPAPASSAPVERTGPSGKF